MANHARPDHCEEAGCPWSSLRFEIRIRCAHLHLRHSGRTRLPVLYSEWRCQRQITTLQPKVLTFDEGNHIRDRFTSSADCNVEGNYDFSIHGCFWHGHDCPRGSRQPKTNIEYWSARMHVTGCGMKKTRRLSLARTVSSGNGN